LGVNFPRLLKNPPAFKKNKPLLFKTMNKEILTTLRDCILLLIVKAENLSTLKTGAQKRQYVLDNIKDQVGFDREIYVSLVDSVLETALHLAKHPELLVKVQKKFRRCCWY
jgi:hypothetical protein